MMKRREILAAMLAAVAGGRGRLAHAEVGPPEKIHLIPDGLDLRNVGRLGDGRLFFVDRQLDSAAGKTRDFVCTFLFAPDGMLVDHTIELIGTRGSYPEGRVGDAEKRQLEALGARMRTDIWVRLFSVESKNAVFGLIPRRLDTGEWRVDCMPGNTLEFFPPWEAGDFDT